MSSCQQQPPGGGDHDKRITPPPPTTTCKTATAASGECKTSSAHVQPPAVVPPKPKSKAILPLIGTTQSGKTTFIKFLHEYCDQEYDHARDLVVGDGVNSCTKVCKRYSLAVPDRTVTLVPKAGSRPASNLISAAGGFGSGVAQQQQQFQQGLNGASSAGGSVASSAGVQLGGQCATRGVLSATASQETVQRQQQQHFSAVTLSMTQETAARDQLGTKFSNTAGIAGQSMAPQQRSGLDSSPTSRASASNVSAAQAAALAAREAAAKSVAMAAEAARMCQTIGSVISESDVSDSDDEIVDNLDAAKFCAEQAAFLRQHHPQKSSLSAPSLAQRDSMSSIASTTTATTSTAFTCESSSGSSGSDSNGMVAIGASMVASATGTGGAGGAGQSSSIMTPEITSVNTSASHSPVMLHGQSMGGLLSQQAQQQQQQLLSQQQYQHMSASHSSSDGGVPEFARPSPPMPATETPSSMVVEPMISATMQTQQSSSSLSSSSLATSQQQHQGFSTSSTKTESDQHDPETLRIVEHAIRIATGLPASGGAQLTTPPPHIAQYIDSMTARHQCQEQYQEECAKQHQSAEQQCGEVQGQRLASGFSFSLKASTSSSVASANSAGASASGEARDRGFFGAESSGVSMETSEQQTKDRGLFGFRKWVGKKVHGGGDATTTTISSDAAQFEHEVGTAMEHTDSMLSTTSTTTSMMTVTDTNVGNANSSASCGAAADQVQVTCQQPPEYPGPMSSGVMLTMSRRSSTSSSSSSSDDSDQGPGRRHRIKAKIGGMLGLSSSTASSSVQCQQQQQEEVGEQQGQTNADLYSQQCQDQLHDSSTEWSSTVHYAVTPSGQVVLDASGPSATMHQGTFPYPTGTPAAAMAGAAAVGGMVGAGVGVASAMSATGGSHGSSSHVDCNTNTTHSNSSQFSTAQSQHATTSTLGFTQQAQQTSQAQYQVQQQQQQQQFQKTHASQFANTCTAATATANTTQIGQSLTEMLARLEQSHRESFAQHNGGSPLSPTAFLLNPHERLEYLEEVEDLLHNRHLQLYVGPPTSNTPRLAMDLIDTPGLLDAAAFTDPFVDLDHLAGILAQVKRSGHVTALVYVINIDRPYDSASLEALVTYLTNLRELCSNLIVVHSSYNVHKVLESAKAAAVSPGSVAGGSEPSSFCLFDLGNRVSEFNKQLAHLGFPDIRPVHVAMDNVVPPTARAGIKALCFEGLHVFLDVVEEFAKQPVTPIERVSMVKLRLIRDVDMHVSVFLTNIIDTIRAQLYTLGQSGNETHLLIAAEKLATTRAELRRIDSELSRLDTDDHVEIDQRTVKRLPMTVVREGTRRALVVLVYESKAGNIRSARLVQPRWPRAYVRHEHVDPKRYVAVLAPPPSSPWAVGPYVHVQLFTHRRDVFAVEIGKLRISKGELAGRLTEQEAELAKWTRKLGEEKRKVAELETRLTTLKRALGVVDGDRLPLELFVEVVEQYREIAKLQYAGKKVDQVLVKALGESVERFFYRRC